MTGATGNIGRMVVDHLLARGASHVRALTASPERAVLPPQVEVVRGSVRSPEALRTAFDGVEHFYLAPSPDTVEQVMALARDAGVRYVVDLSGEPESWWGLVSGAVEASGLAWTHLWPADFVENARMWLPQIRATGAVREPWPDGASTPTAMDDIAEVAAVALLSDDHAGEAYGLTGPEPVSRREMVRAIAEATGRPIEFVRATPEEATDALRPSMGETAEWYVGNVLSYLAGNVPSPNRLVAEITGRPATTFAAWADTHADELRAAIAPA
ncbi:NAD(P)H-binding protein [Pseudonocardia sediminis]|uniref:NAD(P)H-binding protein n=1 Tax=Pseudonocardia sediminis TaxID=1397368 RepID=UPI0030FEBA98